MLAVLYARQIIQDSLHLLLSSPQSKEDALVGKGKEKESSSSLELDYLVSHLFGDEESLLSFLMLATANIFTMPFFSLSKGSPLRNEIPLYNQQHEPKVRNPALKETVDRLLAQILQHPDR